jgi:hypothetical protein
MCTSYLDLPTERPRAGPSPIPSEVQPDIGIIIDHQHLWSQPVKEGIIVFDDWSSYMSGHEVTPPQHPRIL